jgi:hypothetical protein
MGRLMPWFRPALRDTLPPRVDVDSVRALLNDVLDLRNFPIGRSDLSLCCEPERDLSWEVFQGRLLDPAHTRMRRDFEAFTVRREAEPILSLKFDVEAGEIHIVRYYPAYVQEPIGAGNVVEMREVTRLVAELVGSLDLAVFETLSELRDELIGRLFHAIAGTRLPLSSMETPLPAFTFGELFYCYCSGITGPLSAIEHAKFIEALIRSTPPADVASLAAPDLANAELWRTLFNAVSLSPWTDFVEKTLLLLRHLESCGAWTPRARVNFLGWLLRQVGRHLTAYDLVTFHHRGANYPDALLLDLVLTDYLEALAAHPELFADGEEARQRRRALRQGWLVRRQYEGHLVPDQPTSPGEQGRVLPHPRVPEEQILNPGSRRRRLFDSRPLTLNGHTAEALAQAARDLLSSPLERRELGTALFLDRPFGAGLGPAEPDTTLLLSSVGYSPSIAGSRLALLERAGLLSAQEADAVRGGLDVSGLPLSDIGGLVRAGTVSLDDARRVAPDFVFLHTTRSSLTAFREAFDFARVPLPEDAALIVRSPTGSGVRVLDRSRTPRLELEPCLDYGYTGRAGIAVPAVLRVVAMWSSTGEECRLAEGVSVCSAW